MAYKESAPFVYAESFCEALSKELDEYQRSDAELGQAVVWLVGLASTLLTLAVANLEKVKALFGTSYRGIVISLLVAILAGVFSRIVSVWNGREVRGLLLHLYGYLFGYTTGRGIIFFADLSEGWNQAEIVQRLQADFNLDYSFLIKYKASIEDCRTIYRNVYKSQKDSDEQDLARLKSMTGAYLGWTEKERRRMSSPDDSKTLAKVKRRALVARNMKIIASMFFTVSALTFSLAMLLMARLVLC
jgi:hypothetical protein